MNNQPKDGGHVPAHWFRFFAGRWLASTRGLKSSETGILINLLAMMHERGEPLPEDDARLWRQCGATTKSMFDSARETLLEYRHIVIRGGGLWSDYMQGETDYRRERTEIAKKSASYRGKKSQQNQQNQEANAYRDKSIEIEGGSSSRRSEISSSTIERGRDVRPEGAPSSTSGSSSYRVGEEIYVTNYGSCHVHEVLAGRGIIVARVSKSQRLIWTGLKEGKPVFIADAPIEPPQPASATSRKRASA